MKKIVINGGNFYKAFLVASYENISLSAGEYMTLISTPKSGTIYLFEVTRTPQSDIIIYNGGDYIVRNPYNECESPSKYTARIKISSQPILLKSSYTAITISVNVYEIKEFVPVKIPIVGSSAYDFIQQEKASLYQFPEFTIGKKYKVKLTPLYSGQLVYYQGGEKYRNDNAVANTTYEFEYTATAGSSNHPFVRDYSNTDHQLYIEINEVPGT